VVPVDLAAHNRHQEEIEVEQVVEPVDTAAQVEQAHRELLATLAPVAVVVVAQLLYPESMAVLAAVGLDYLAKDVVAQAAPQYVLVPSPEEEAALEVLTAQVLLETAEEQAAYLAVEVAVVVLAQVPVVLVEAGRWHTSIIIQ